MTDSGDQRHDDEHQDRAHAPGGAVLDGHGEVQIDPEAADRDAAASEPDTDVTAKHRRHADAIESHDEQAADETRGATPDQ